MPPVTFVIPGNGSSALSGSIPLGYDVQVQSVVASIDNGGGTAEPVELYIADPSGVVIANQAQQAAIPAGQQGLATWALRLAGDSGATDLTGFIRYVVDNVGAWLSVETTDGATNPSTRFLSAGGFQIEDTSGGGSAIDLVARLGGTVTLAADSGTVQALADHLFAPQLVDAIIRAATVELSDAAAGGVEFLAISRALQQLVVAGRHLLLEHSITGPVLPGDGIVIATSPVQQVGFYGHAPTGQQARPVTLGDVIGLLVNLGLSA